VRGNVIQNNTFGVYFNASGALQSEVSNNCIRFNNVPGAASGNGIYSDQGLSNALIQGNTFTGHDNASIILVGGPAAASSHKTLSITGNQIINDAPVIVVNTTASDISGNTSQNSAGSGIFFGGGVSGVNVTFNFIEECAFTGINLRFITAAQGGFNVTAANSGNTIAGNEVERCGDSGIRVRDGSNNNFLTNNEVNRSGSDGLAILDGAFANTFFNNHSDRNSAIGFHVAVDAAGCLNCTQPHDNLIIFNRMRRDFGLDCRDET